MMPATELQHFADSGKERVFASPWEAHAFALTIKLHEQGYFNWSEWSQYLADSIARWPADSNSNESATYYAQWLDALERLLSDKGMVDGKELLAKRHDLQSDPGH